MAKKKIQLTENIDVDAVLLDMAEEYSGYDLNKIDGLKIEFESSWAHLRKSNTEPIIRIYTEAQTAKDASDLADQIISQIEVLANNND